MVERDDRAEGPTEAAQLDSCHDRPFLLVRDRDAGGRATAPAEQVQPEHGAPDEKEAYEGEGDALIGGARADVVGVDGEGA